MTVLDANLAPDIRSGPPRFASTLADLMRMSWPIMLGATVMALLHTGQAGLLGHIEDRQPLFHLSMLQPWYLLFFAFLESLAITAQVFSARSKRQWPRGGVKVAVFALGLMAIAILGLLVAGVSAGQGLIVDRLALMDAGSAALLPAYLLTLAPFVAFEILNGALRGQGRTLPGFLVLAVAVVVNLGVTWHLLHDQGQGIEALFTANLVSGLVATVLMLGLFIHALRGAGKAPLVPSLMRMGTLLAVVGVPVFLSMVVSFFSSSILFQRMFEFGPEHASGFLVAIRFRFFLMIPAAALATSLAVLLNQEDGQGAEARGQRLAQGAWALLAFYLAAVAVVFALRVPLVDLMVEAPEVRAAALATLTLLLPSFILVAFVAFAQVILDNLGRGVRVLVWTVVLETATCLALLRLAVDMQTALWTLIWAALIYATIFAVEYVLLIRKPGAAEDHPQGDAA